MFQPPPPTRSRSESSHSLNEWRLANLPTTQRVDAKIIASARNGRPQSAQSVRIGKEIQELVRPQLTAATVIHSGGVKGRAAWSSS